MKMEMLHNLESPILLKGGKTTAYRDPAIYYKDGVFHLFFTYVETQEDGTVYMYVGKSKSKDFKNWSKVQKLTARDRSKNFSSPGNIIHFKDKWIMCLQTYCRENGEKYGNGNCRIYLMESEDLDHWGEPKMIHLKGMDIKPENMGRMIDPYLLEDKEEEGKWWCFYKQNGVSMSYSYDLEHWTYAGFTKSGENVCVIKKDEEYIMFHSPENGIAMLKSTNKTDWIPYGEVLTFDQENWPWARGRITAGCVLDGRDIEGIGQYVMFFHGTGPYNEDVIFDTYACIGVAWSRDLKEWNWPLKCNKKKIGDCPVKLPKV